MHVGPFIIVVLHEASHASHHVPLRGSELVEVGGSQGSCREAIQRSGRDDAVKEAESEKQIHVPVGQGGTELVVFRPSVCQNWPLPPIEK